MPFEINRITIEPRGFQVTFTKPIEPVTGRAPDSYAISAFTDPYHAGYGGPEIEQHQPGVKADSLAKDGLSAIITLKNISGVSCTNSTSSACVLVTGIGFLAHQVVDR